MAGFSALVVTLDTMILGWRPHDLEKAFIPFGHGLGIQVGASDPVFMSRFGKEPITETTFQWPYQPDALNEKIAEGDEGAMEGAFLGVEWLKECNTSFKSWDDLKHLRQFWDGPLILKGIQHIVVRILPPRWPIWAGIPRILKWEVDEFCAFQDAERALEYGVNGIIISNHGRF